MTTKYKEMEKPILIELGRRWSLAQHNKLVSWFYNRLVSESRGKRRLVAITNSLSFTLAAAEVAAKMEFPLWVCDETNIANLMDYSDCLVLIDDDIMDLQKELGTNPIWHRPNPEEREDVNLMAYDRERILTNIYYFDSFGKAQLVSHMNLMAAFEDLDKTIVDRDDRVFVISETIDPVNKLIDSAWAWQAGLPVVMEDVKKPRLQEMMDRGAQDAMDFGLFFFGSYKQGEADEKNRYELLIESAKYADKNDFEAIWTPERHFNDFGGLFPNPSVLGSALSMVTEQLNIRSGSIVSPLHDTLRITEDWSVVDNLSNGRVSLSFASGWQCDDFVFFPDRYASRHEEMMRQIDEVRKLWRGESVIRTNGLGKEIDVKVYPKPIQEELPVWVTVSGRVETFQDAGKAGCNILTHLLWQDSSELIDKIKAYREALAEAGFDPTSRKVVVMAHTFLGEDREEVIRTVEKPLKDYIRSSVHLIETMARSKDVGDEKQEAVGRYGRITDDMPEELMEELLEMAFQRFVSSASLIGNLDHAHEMIEKLNGYGVDEIACLIDFGVEKEDILNSFQYLNQLRKDYKKNTSDVRQITGHFRCSEVAHLKTCRQVESAWNLVDTILVEDCPNADEESIEGKSIRYIDDLAQNSYLKEVEEPTDIWLFDEVMENEF